MDPTLEWGECEEERADGAMCDKLTTTPITIPLYHSRGGGKEMRCEVRLRLLVYAIFQFLCKSPSIAEKCCFD